MWGRVAACAVAVLMVTSTTTTAAAADGLSGKWRFDVSSGKVRDVTGQGRDLALSGSWSKASGRGGAPAVRFASKSIAKASAHRSLDPGSSPFAVSIVFRAPSGTDIFQGDSPNIAQKGRYHSSGQWKLQLIKRDGGRVQCRMKGTRTAVMVTSPVKNVAADRKWHKASCVKRNKRVVLVVDGVRAVKHVSVGSVSSGQAMTVANKSARSGSDQFRGIVDALAIAKGDKVLRKVARATRR